MDKTFRQREERDFLRKSAFFTGIVVDDEATKQGLLEYLRGKNLVQKDAMGRETILSHLVDQFLDGFRMQGIIRFVQEGKIHGRLNA